MKHLKVLEEHLRYELIASGRSFKIEKEMNYFIRDTYPNIKMMNKYIRIGNLNLGVTFDLEEEFEKEMVRYYPEEFI